MEMNLASLVGVASGAFAIAVPVVKWYVKRAETSEKDAKKLEERSVSMQIQGVREKVVDVEKIVNATGLQVVKIRTAQIKAEAREESLHERIARLESMWDRITTVTIRDEAKPNMLEERQIAPGTFRVSKKK